MYIMTIKGTRFSVPKDSIGLLAHSKGYKGNIYDLDNAIKYLESLGLKLEEA